VNGILIFTILNSLFLQKW